MKALILIPLLLLAGCSKPKEEQPRPDPAPRQARAPAPNLAALAGLYEGGAPGRRNQLCIAGRDGRQRFGIVAWGASDASCSGIGAVTSGRDTVRLAMQGDSPCTIAARIEGKALVFPAALPAGCSYYCGARASLAGARFTQQGLGDAAARKATDLVGDSLCG